MKDEETNIGDPIHIESGKNKSLRMHSVGEDTLSTNPQTLLSKEEWEKLVQMARGSHRKPMANAAPLGLGGFCLTVMVLSLCNISVRGVTAPNIAVSLAYFFGGIAQFTAGILLLVAGEAFLGVVFSSYGTFWLSWAAIYTQWFGIIDAYKDDPSMFSNAVGFFLLGWLIHTKILLLCTLRGSGFVFTMFFLLDITFVLLTIASFTQSSACTKAGGYLGLVTGVNGWYLAWGMLSNPENTFLPYYDFKMPF